MISIYAFTNKSFKLFSTNTLTQSYFVFKFYFQENYCYSLLLNKKIIECNFIKFQFHFIYKKDYFIYFSRKRMIFIYFSRK